MSHPHLRSSQLINLLIQHANVQKASRLTSRANTLSKRKRTLIKRRLGTPSKVKWIKCNSQPKKKSMLKPNFNTKKQNYLDYRK